MIFPRENNPHWPLPADYPQLSGHGQRLARINACRMFETPELAVHSWRFFCDWYLVPEKDPDGRVVWDPGFYKQPYLPRAALHYHLIRWWSSNTFTAIAAPRGSAKSTCKKSWALQLLLNKPGTTFASFLAKDKFVTLEGASLKYQLETNQRLIQDFGAMQPRRGGNPWNNELLVLNNRNEWFGWPIDGKARGGRPNIIVPDDIDKDQRTEEGAKVDLNVLRRTVLKVLVPMLNEDGQMHLVGTRITGGLLAYFLDPSCADAAGKHFFRIIVPAEDSEGRNAWQEKFTPAYLTRQRAMLGDSFYRSEYLNELVSESEALLKVMPLQHEYELLPADRCAEPGYSPLDDMQTQVRWHHVTGSGESLQLTERLEPWHEWLQKMRRYITFDYAPTCTTTSDFSAICVIGVDAQGVWWLLDLWHDKKKPADVLAAIWSLAMKWQVQNVGGEGWGIQMDFTRMVKEFGDSLRSQRGWAPRVIPIKYPAGIDKGERIRSALEWRVNQSMLKLPGQRRLQEPIRTLYRQLADFTVDLGNLPHDDAIDALASGAFLPGCERAKQQPVKAPSAVERIKQGELFLPGTRLPAILGMDWRRLRREDLDGIMRATEAYNQHQLGLRSDDETLQVTGDGVEADRREWRDPDEHLLVEDFSDAP